MFIAALLSGLPCPAGSIEPAADAPPPLTPEESQRQLRVPSGFRVELVASEPLLADPTDMAFDARGRLFVCELYGYNLEGHYDVIELNKTGQLDLEVRRILAPPEVLERAERESHGTVKLLEDADGDGRMDRATVWADDLPPCYGLAPARDGVIVLCAPDVVFLADRDGDGRADFRETLFTGFGVGEMWTRISNPEWGVDNWIYAAGGQGSAGTIQGPHLPKPVQLGNTGFRFKADGTAIEPISGNTGGFGLALDDFDNRFLVSNQQHALHVAPLPYRYLARNPYYAAPQMVNNICSYGHPARIHPQAPPDPWRLARSQQSEWVKFYGAAETTMGLVTAACAPFIYRGDQFPEEHRGAHFSCECAYNLLHLCRLEPVGAGYRAVRAIEGDEFLTSTEQWFRPVNLADGPDGTLYIVDMYREIIEDYSAIPRHLQQQYGLITGWDRGRIWRVLHDPGTNGAGRAQAPARDRASRAFANTPEALLKELSSPNAWRRLTAQRLLVEQGDRSVAEPLRQLLRNGDSAQARLHALHTLAGLDSLDAGTLASALNDIHPGVRRHALQLSDEWLDREPTLLEAVLGLIDDPDPQVRLQVALTLGQTHSPRRMPALATLANRFGDDSWMQAAIVSSVPEDAGELLARLIQQPDLSDAGRRVAGPLVAVIGARGQPDETARLLEMIGQYPGDRAEVLQADCLTRLAEALKRGVVPGLEGTGGAIALRRFVAGDSPSLRRLGLQLAGILKLAQSPELLAVFDSAAQTSLDETLPLADRKAAIALLASAPFASWEATGRRLLAPSQTLDVQLAAVAALATSDDPEVGPVLLSGWGGYSPRLQTAVLDVLFKRQDRIKALLAAITSETIPRPGLDPLRRQQLLANPDDEIRRLAGPILARDTSSQDRQQLMSRYQAALSGPRDPLRGRDVFQVNCSSCHVLEGIGVATGPELIAATKGRADETILLDILQPSDQITVGFRTYQIVTTSGDNLSGTLSAETPTSVTLPDEDGIPRTVLRKDIASMLTSDISLMPANFDELIEPQAVADLLGYLRQLGSAGPGPVLTLFEDDPAFALALHEGDGTVEVTPEDVHTGSRALRVTPPQRFSARIAGWDYPIMENPGPGQYRYLRFAWKAPETTGVMLELAAAGQWPQADDEVRRYHAGRNSTGWAARSVSDHSPSEWTVVMVDLWQDCGEFTLTGIAPTAMGGPALFDSIQLLRDQEQGPSHPVANQPVPPR